MRLFILLFAAIAALFSSKPAGHSHRPTGLRP